MSAQTISSEVYLSVSGPFEVFNNLQIMNYSNLSTFSKICSKYLNANIKIIENGQPKNQYKHDTRFQAQEKHMNSASQLQNIQSVNTNIKARTAFVIN